MGWSYQSVDMIHCCCECGDLCPVAHAVGVELVADCFAFVVAEVVKQGKVGSPVFSVFDSKHKAAIY